MALPGTAVFEVQTGGSDTLNGGGYATVSTGKPTDLTTDANTANTATPIVSSATYNFVAADVGNWVYIVSGTNWVPGWYKVTAVGSNKATLNAAIGAGVLANGTPTTAVGVATVGTPTAGTYSVDYSQVAGVVFSLTGLTTAAANAIILTAAATKAMVGSLIIITGGTNFTAGTYYINACTAGVSLTVDRNCTTAAGAAGTAGIGGALASPGMAGSLAIANNYIWSKNGTYSITSTTSNVAGGRITTPSGSFFGGYGTVRGDMGTAPILQASGIATTVLVTYSGTVVNIKVDGASLTSIQGFAGSGNNGQYAYKCTGINCTNSAFNTLTTGVTTSCYASGCSTAVAFTGNAYFDCVADSNTAGGFSVAGNGGITMSYCIASNNTGIGIQMAQGGLVLSCTLYNNTSDGIKQSANPQRTQVINCLLVSNGGFGINFGGTLSNPFFAMVLNCATYSNTGGPFNGTNAQIAQGNIALTADPFINAAGGNFALNITAGGGASCRAAGIPGAFPGLSGTTGYLDIGAVQSRVLTVAHAFVG